MTATIRIDTRRKLSSGKYPVQITVSYSGKVHRLKVSEMTEAEYSAATRTRNPDRAWRDRFTAWERRANLILADMPVFSWSRFKDEWRGKRGEGEYLYHYFQTHPGSVSTKRVYGAAAASFRKAWGNIRVVDITSDKVRQWSETADLSPNSVTSYLRCLHAVLVRAQSAGYLETVPAFTVGATKPREGYLTASEMKAIIDYRTLNPEEAEARDLFVLSYYLFAPNFADLLSWTGDNVKGDTIQYQRKKTGKLVIVPITGDIENLINRYGELHTGRGYLLRYYRTCRTERERDKIKNRVLTRTRNNLRRIATRLGLPDTHRFMPSILRQTVYNILISQGAPAGIVTGLMGTSEKNAGRHYFEPGAYSELSKKLTL